VAAGKLRPAHRRVWHRVAQAGRHATDTFRRADTNMRNLTEEESLRGKERLRRAVRHAGETPSPEPRTNWLDLLVLR
jgi:hypothetical protein